MSRMNLSPRKAPQHARKYHRQRVRINWLSTGVAIVVVSGLVVGGVFLSTSLKNRPASMLQSGMSSGGDPALQVSSTFIAPPTPNPNVPLGSSQDNPVDLSAQGILVSSNEENINYPGLYADKLVFSAGTGSLREPLLQSLYLYNLNTGLETRLATAQVKDGEIYETLINEYYVVWLDTDMNGTNRLYYMITDPTGSSSELSTGPEVSSPSTPTPSPSTSPTPSASPVPSASPSPSPDTSPSVSPEAGDENAPLGESVDVSLPINTPILIKECDNRMPKLRLSGQYLIFTEQNEDKEERLYLVDLATGEDLSLMFYTESLSYSASTYAVSAPSIYGTEVIWAASDTRQSATEKAVEEHSSIYCLDISQLGNDTYMPEVYHAGMYVHEPINNADCWAWIDRNKAPDSTLYVRYKDNVTPVATGVTSYSLGDGFVVYGMNSAVYVYFYDTRMYGRLTAVSEQGILPVASGRRVVWFQLGADSEGDQLKTIILD